MNWKHWVICIFAVLCGLLCGGMDSRGCCLSLECSPLWWLFSGQQSSGLPACLLKAPTYGPFWRPPEMIRSDEESELLTASCLQLIRNRLWSDGLELPCDSTELFCVSLYNSNSVLYAFYLGVNTPVSSLAYFLPKVKLFWNMQYFGSLSHTCFFWFSVLHALRTHAL